MSLPPLSGLKRPKNTERASAADGGVSPAVVAARTRARQRLVGALVLLAVGVVAFPLIFETQPRPLAADTPIKLSQRDSGTVQATPPSAARAPAAEREPPPDAGVEQAAPATSATVQAAASGPMAAPVPTAVTVPALVPAPAPAPAPASVDLKAALRPAVPAPADQAASAPAASRFVVQAGAYSDPRTLREARSKAESLGLKTYTQVVDTEGGRRTRVRVGPFDNRAEAEAAARKLKAGGLPANILSL